VGGALTHSKVRVITATHKNLKMAVEKGEFREDLYFRINEMCVELPPLRERTKDIPILAQSFLDRFVSRNDLQTKYLSREVLDFLQNQEWRGNIRELSSWIRKAAVLSEKEEIGINITNLAPLRGQKSSPVTLNLVEQKRMLTIRLVQKAMDQTDQNKTKAAELLGITPRSLFRLYSEYEMGDIENDIDVML
jgi:DNA-binding NtrC family response regulator